ncbi:Uncharacterized protein EbC_38490 [Erwinia billingiae Eb661]|uniref:DUF1090 domain-containing protein n=1 Tax=Erwinia billingiae (strain Eb661) TaxID=634500 RepID=D8MX23_ERWBE|nr:DUF1090 domain-containing protein [Erwinia billingiae]CAX61380.1 Uncharacterized protein EbC_38490 [Erwinia billingiae Eb661]
MKKIILLTSLLMVLGSAQAAEPATGCSAKRAEVVEQIKYADAHGNSSQKAGLEKALKEIDQHCTNEGLLADRQQRVSEKQAKVAEREADLREAQASGNSKKIAKQQKKLDSANEELKDAQAQLSK